MLTVFAVAAGGAIGSVLRYLAGKGMTVMVGAGFPYGTLFVNVTGSLVMGLLVALFARHGHVSHDLRAFLAIGVLGGYTTFSSFSLDAVTLWERGDVMNAVLYVFASMALSIGALFAGMMFIRGIPA